MIRVLVEKDPVTAAPALNLGRAMDLAAPLSQAGVRGQVVSEFRMYWSGDVQPAVEALLGEANIKKDLLWSVFSRVGARVQKLTKSRTAAIVILGAGYIDVGHYGRQVLELVNQARAKVGAQPLKWSQAAADVAMTRAREIVARPDHRRPDGRDWVTAVQEAKLQGSAFGENIATGQREPGEVMASWLNSPGHRNNILNPAFNRLGVGALAGPDGQLRWTQLFLTQREDN
jgi:hypothetical protein